MIRLLIFSGLLFCFNLSAKINSPYKRDFPTKQERKMSRNKLEKVKGKINKSIRRAKSDSKKSRPWLALGLAFASAILLIIGLIASFGLIGWLAGLGFVTGFILSVVTIFIAIHSLRHRRDSQKPKLTTFISLVAFTIALTVGLLGLLGIISAISNI